MREKIRNRAKPSYLSCGQFHCPQTIVSQNQNPMNSLGARTENIVPSTLAIQEFEFEFMF